MVISPDRVSSKSRSTFIQPRHPQVPVRGVGGVRRLTVVGLTSNDLKNGMNIEVDGVPMKVLEFLHVKPGKGAAFVRSKLKNLLNGSNMEKTFRAGESVGEAQVIKTEMQFSYDDGEEYQFMNMESYETEGVPKSVFVNNAGLFLLEGMVVQVGRWVDGSVDRWMRVRCVKGPVPRRNRSTWSTMTQSIHIPPDPPLPRRHR